jgi:hypothetical protein
MAKRRRRDLAAPCFLRAGGQDLAGGRTPRPLVPGACSGLLDALLGRRFRCAFNAINGKRDRPAPVALLCSKHPPKQSHCDCDSEHSTYRVQSPSRMQAVLCPKLSARVARHLGAQHFGVTALQLARSEPALVAGRRVDTADREQRDTVEAAEDRHLVAPRDAIRQEAPSRLGQEQPKHLGHTAWQLGRTHRRTRDIVLNQQHWRFFIITRGLRGFVVAFVSGIVMVSEREAASQQLHKVDQQCAGTKKRSATPYRTVRTVWYLDV